jgi:uncharacterized cupredoxin-like copper-binding protein
MYTTKVRAVSFAVFALAALLVWALPASAKPTTKTTAKATIVNVTAGKPSEFRFTLSAKSVKVGSVTFKLSNKGALPHTFKVCSSPKGGSANSCAGTGTAQVSPGATATLTVKFAKTGSYEYLCTVPGHAAAGMKGDLKVT